MRIKNEIHPTTNYDEYGIIVSDDDEYSNNIRPSELIKNNESILKFNTKLYSDSDTDSDGYDDNNIIMVGRRRPSFIKNTLKSLSNRIDIAPIQVKQSFNHENNISKNYFSIFKHKTLLWLSLFTGSIISLLVIF